MKDSINKAIIKGLCEAQKDDNSAIESFIKRTEKVFHNKADVYLEGEYSDDPKVLIHLYEDCYQYWNEFVKKCLPMFTFDDIFFFVIVLYFGFSFKRFLIDAESASEVKGPLATRTGPSKISVTSSSITSIKG